MPRMTVLLPLVTIVALGSGCPSDATAPATTTGPSGVSIADDDPRVVRDGQDLYPSESAPNPISDGPAPGSGRPDTTNGVCKLFAPKLPEPACCPIETGFDAEAIKQLCGHELYMGESIQQSCGYFFLHDTSGGAAVSIRASVLNEPEVAAAAGSHDRQIARVTKTPGFASTAIPGVEGGLWSTAQSLHWAFLPGWDRVRLVSWADGACPDAVMPEVLALIAAAKPPPANAPRDLIPKARQ